LLAKCDAALEIGSPETVVAAHLNPEMRRHLINTSPHYYIVLANAAANASALFFAPIGAVYECLVGMAITITNGIAIAITIAITFVMAKGNGSKEWEWDWDWESSLICMQIMDLPRLVKATETFFNGLGLRSFWVR